MEPDKAKEAIREKFIGKRARVLTKNNRSFEGKIMCVDYKFNLILHEAIAEIAPEHNCPLNYQLYNYTDSKLQYMPPSQLEEEEKMRLIKEYMGSHYYFGAIMVAGNDIAKLELLKEEEEGKEGAE
jgi:small nuclear ribonucleoprotein (snRNP)-like protein